MPQIIQWRTHRQQPPKSIPDIPPPLDSSGKPFRVAESKRKERWWVNKRQSHLQPPHIPTKMVRLPRLGEALLFLSVRTMRHVDCFCLMQNSTFSTGPDAYPSLNLRLSRPDSFQCPDMRFNEGIQISPCQQYHHKVTLIPLNLDIVKSISSPLWTQFHLQGTNPLSARVCKDLQINI